MLKVSCYFYWNESLLYLWSSFPLIKVSLTSAFRWTDAIIRWTLLSRKRKVTLWLIQLSILEILEWKPTHVWTGLTEAATETWKQRMTIEHPMFVNWLGWEHSPVLVIRNSGHKRLRWVISTSPQPHYQMIIENISQIKLCHTYRPVLNTYSIASTYKTVHMV